MSLRFRASSIAIFLCTMAAFAAAQASGIGPVVVSADNTLSMDLLRAPTSTEPLAANGRVRLNLDNGQVAVELHQATPESNYTVLFVSASASASVQVATIVTDQGGEGIAQGMLSSGAYVGIFQVLRADLVQFTTATASFNLGVTVSASTTVSSESTTLSTSTESESNVSTSNSAKFVLGVEPVSSSISAGDFAKFNIRIARGPNADASAVIFLVARGVPPSSVAIFTPNGGVADPEFDSTLTIVTSPNTPADNYEVTVVARVDGQEFSTQVALEITATTSATATMTVSTAANLFMTVTTDQTQYQPNATVTVQGQVTDATGSAIANAAVSTQVDSPTGAEVFFENNIQTDSAGTFQAQVTLTASAALGTYTVFATASQIGYLSIAGRATFVVGASTTPSVSITAVYAGDSSGNPVPTVPAGQTVWIWVVVHNNGATFQGVVWVQVHDPNGVPVQIGIHIETLNSGETIKDGLGFTLPGNAAHGVYRVDALVSDKLISQGGTFLADAQTQFALTD
ncbi:MAG: MG2 domain-containing protein [Candidatus Bathyarchaeia archaeon]